MLDAFRFKTPHVLGNPRLLLKTISTPKSTQDVCSSTLYKNKHKNKRATICRRLKGMQDDDFEHGQGDRLTQDLLAEIVTLEIRKVMVTEFVEDKSAELTQIAEQANTEFQQIADDTIKDLDEAGLKVLEKVEAEVQACEEELASVWAEFNINESTVDDFELKMQKERSNGLFFKTLHTPQQRSKELPSEQRYSSQLEAKRIEDITKQSFTATARRNVYIFLVFVLIFGLVDVLPSGIVAWPKILIYSLLLVMLVTQLLYEISLSSKNDT